MADVVASDGSVYERGERWGSVNVPRTELSSGLMRILTGISSKIFENVRRWLTKLKFLLVNSPPPHLRNPSWLPCRAKVVSSMCLDKGFREAESAERCVPLGSGCCVWI